MSNPKKAFPELSIKSQFDKYIAANSYVNNMPKANIKMVKECFYGAAGHLSLLLTNELPKLPIKVALGQLDLLYDESDLGSPFKNQKSTLKHISVEYQFNFYINMLGFKISDLPKGQVDEMRKVYYSSFRQLLTVQRDIIGAMPALIGIKYLKSIQEEVLDFFNENQ